MLRSGLLLPLLHPFCNCLALPCEHSAFVVVSNDQNRDYGRWMHDLGDLFDQHVAFEFQNKDVDATMATMVEDPTVIHVPVLTGGRGVEQLHAFYRDAFIPAWPDDVEVEQLSRTVGSERVVDELIIRFTHTREMPFWLPGIAATGRHVEIPLVVVMGFRAGKVTSEHIYWDQASLLAQIGLLDASDLPVLGPVQAQALIDPSVTLNEIITAAH